MKRLLAALLTGCLILQPVTGYGTAVWGADFSSGVEESLQIPGEVGNTDVQPDVENAPGENPDAVGGGETGVPQEPAEEVIPPENTPELAPPVQEETVPEDPSIEVLPEEPSQPETDETVDEPVTEETPAPEETVQPPEAEEQIPETGEEAPFGDVEQAVPGDQAPTLAEGTETGSIEVKVVSMLPFELVDDSGSAIAVTVSAGDQTKNVSISGKDATAIALFENLNPGKCTVKVSAAKFADYTQDIAVKANTTSRIEVTTARLQTGTSANPGWLRLGDVTNDHVIDDKDLKEMLRVIRAGGTELSANLTMNVFSSDKDVPDTVEEVDLSDLQFLVQSMGGSQISNVAESFVPPANLVTVGDNTTQTGDIGNMLKGEESVKLKPSKGGDISPENAVEIGFALAPEGATEEQTPKIDGITIETPTAVDEDGNLTSDIASGTITIEYYLNGTAVSKEVSIEDGRTIAHFAAPAPQEESPVESFEDDGQAQEELPAEPAPEENGDNETIPDEVVETPGDNVEFFGGSEEQAETPEAEPTETPVAEPEESPSEGLVEGPSDEELIADPGILFMASKLFSPLTVYAAEQEIAPHVSFDADGSLVVDLGNQVAVKKVTIKVTGVKKEDKTLVDIAKVEFLNDMDQRIPAPELSIPTIDKAQTEGSIISEEFTVYWSSENNVTGYDLFISGPVKNQGDNKETQIVRVKEPHHLVTMINDKPIKNFGEYTVKVRSVNGDWTSPWSDELKVTPRPKEIPEPVDNVSAKGAYRALNVSWKMMKDAQGYMVYYRAKTDADAGTNPAPDDTFEPVVEGFQRLSSDQGEDAYDGLVNRGMLTGNSTVIRNLPDGTSYYVYVIGWNSVGWGKPSLVQIAETTGGEVPRLPEYNLINKSTAVGEVSNHIKQAIHGTHGKAHMVNSPIDEANKDTPTNVTYTEWADGVVDNNYDSYWIKENEWDDGVSYLDDNFARGITVSFDAEYEMSYLTFSDANFEGEPSLVRILYWNEEGKETRQEVGADLLRRTDDNGHPYFIARFHKPIVAERIMMCLSTGYTRINMKVGEMHFHKYSEIEGEIYGLYKDDMHSELAEGVDETLISSLEAKLEQKDPESGELHPLYDYLKLELKNARDILTMKDVKTVKVETGITARKDGTLNYGGLNAWQPLGKSVCAGETITIFVGHNFKKVGDNSDLKLVVTQYHSESNALSKSYTLKVGKNDFTVPNVGSGAYELGGQLYVEYTGNNKEDIYSVRVSGGVDIPVLNLYHKTEPEKTNAISAYLTELQNYVGTIQSNHEKIHTANKNTNYPYNETLCILNATDIMMDQMMYSVPATQVLAGLPKDGDKVTALKTSLDAMEQTMTLFYQHKGLTNMDGNTKHGNNNRLSTRHLNIRYMRMFAGAFMYAAGDHIGIEYPQTTVASAAKSWDSFGWGIAHEIGHDINDSKYAIAEITNNYFAQLLTIPNGTRFNFEDVYKKVTSGEIGRSSNGAVQLALYWQLHLAFDNNSNDRYIYDNYDEMFNNLFFARVDTYSRNPGAAPQKMKVERDGKEVDLLSQNDGVDQNLMRLSCAAANANILPFFERWGMVPNSETRQYAALYGPPTEKAIYYVNEKARGGANQGDGIKGQNVVTASVTAQNQYATLTLSSSVSAEQLLGYEIIRGTYNGGELHKEVVGFVEAAEGGVTTYVDKISTMNNRVMYYEVKAVDKALNYSASASAGSVKIETGGALNKENWTVEAVNMISPEDSVPITPGPEDPDMGYNLQQLGGVTQKYPHTIDRVIDSNNDTTYTGTAYGDASIVIDMKTMKEVTSLKYKGSSVPTAVISVGTGEGESVSWTVVKTCSLTDGETVWFDPEDPEDKGYWIGTYDARYIGIAVPEGGISISEIEVCGPTGDNVEFRTEAETSTPAVGILSENYTYSDGSNHVIPQGSLTFVGKYKGNPAYNVVMLFDSDGNIIGGDQIIFASVPPRGDLGETSDGTWVYYIEPGSAHFEDVKQLKQVRAELYRVDDAQTLAGERMVSDTVFLDMPTTLPSITLSGGNIPGVTN